ncbi:hypothetical protein GCM10010284_54480 [Streptomyces rubiginosohelvolus]|nr:hypothetical protein GCM10010284_54480 [Streptomyces rubiginosohelvolus]
MQVKGLFLTLQRVACPGSVHPLTTPKAYAVHLSRTLVMIVTPDSGDTPRTHGKSGARSRRCQPVMAAFRVDVLPLGCSNLAVA